MKFAKVKYLNKMDYGRPVPVTRRLIASWRIQLPEEMWEWLAKENEMTQSQAVQLANFLADKYPREWRYCRIDSSGLSVCRYSLYEPRRLRKDISDT
jgi:hypothetical protein